MSLQNLNYMCVTAHFINCDWIMHQKILKFCLVSNHKGETIGRVLETSLIEWGVDSIFKMHPLMMCALTIEKEGE